MKIIDLHCDTLMKCYLDGFDIRSEEKLDINVEKLFKGEALAQCFAIFIPTHDCMELYNVKESPNAYYDSCYKVYQKALADNGNRLAEARSVADIFKNRDAGKVSAILTIEDSVLVEGRLPRIDELYADGVRMMSLTWNYENSVGFPQSSDPELMSRGLKDFGIDAILRMGELGIVVDVSHLSRGGFYDVAKHAKAPFIASHSCADALCAHGRNLTDEQLKLLADKGGICGVNYYSKFLKPEKEISCAPDIVEHMVYIKEKAGIETVALGSDFDGIDCEIEYKDFAGMHIIIDEMTKFFTGDEIDKICSGNALRLFKECWK